MVMGHADRIWRIPGTHRPVADLGSGASFALLYALHAAAVEKLAGERRIHYCGILAGARGAHRRELPWMEIVSGLVNDPGHSLIDFDCRLHGLSFRPGEGARSLAKPAAAAAPAGSGFARRLGRSLDEFGLV